MTSWEIIRAMTTPSTEASTMAKRDDRRRRREQRWAAISTRPLDILGWVFLVDFVLTRLGPDGPPWWQLSLTVISGIVWIAFVIDYVVRLSFSVHRWVFIRSHPLDLVMVLVPMLRILRAVLLIRRSFKSVSTGRIAGSLLTIVAFIVVVGALMEYAVEHDAPGANITTIGLAFWWAIVTTTTVGYGDTYPVTPIGQIIASVIMLVGIGLIGTVSATVAAWFVKHKPKADSGAAPPVDPVDGVAAALAVLTAQLQVLTDQQAELQRAIARLGIDGQHRER